MTNMATYWEAVVRLTYGTDARRNSEFNALLFFSYSRPIFDDLSNFTMVSETHSAVKSEYPT